MTWKYLPVLNACITVLVSIGLGAVLSYFKIFDKSFVKPAVRFVFYVALPSLVIRGIGINVDFYSDKNIWKYICCFLILRAIALVLCFGSVAFQRKKTPGSVGIGDVAVRWLCLTWISTVIMGIPILTAVFGPNKGGLYGILAGISSFIFQLPFQLFFLECHSLEKEEMKCAPSELESSSEEGAESIVPDGTVESAIEVEQRMKEVSIDEEEMYDVRVEVEPRMEEVPIEKEETPDVKETSNEVEVRNADNKWSMLAKFSSKYQWKKIGLKVLKNPVLWGIFLGFLISLTTVGRKYLWPGNPAKGVPPEETYVPGLAWIDATLAWFGACVSPLSLFAMGIWMHQQGRQLIAVKPLELSMYMLSKLVLVPLIMVGLAKGLNLNDNDGRAAVLIATLPISLASFSLGNQYKIGEPILAANVAVGTALMLPTVLIWNIVMDAIDLFPV